MAGPTMTPAQAAAPSPGLQQAQGVTLLCRCCPLEPLSLCSRTGLLTLAPTLKCKQHPWRASRAGRCGAEGRGVVVPWQCWVVLG